MKVTKKSIHDLLLEKVYNKKQIWKRVKQFQKLK